MNFSRLENWVREHVMWKWVREDFRPKFVYDICIESAVSFHGMIPKGPPSSHVALPPLATQLEHKMGIVPAWFTPPTKKLVHVAPIEDAVSVEAQSTSFEAQESNAVDFPVIDVSPHAPALPGREKKTRVHTDEHSKEEKNEKTKIFMKGPPSSFLSTSLTRLEGFPTKKIALVPLFNLSGMPESKTHKALGGELVMDANPHSSSKSSTKEVRTLWTECNEDYDNMVLGKDERKAHSAPMKKPTPKASIEESMSIKPQCSSSGIPESNISGVPAKQTKPFLGKTHTFWPDYDDCVLFEVHAAEPGILKKRSNDKKRPRRKDLKDGKKVLKGRGVKLAVLDKEFRSHANERGTFRVTSGQKLEAACESEKR